MSVSSIVAASLAIANKAVSIAGVAAESCAKDLSTCERQLRAAGIDTGATTDDMSAAARAREWVMREFVPNIIYMKRCCDKEICVQESRRDLVVEYELVDKEIARLQALRGECDDWIRLANANAAAPADAPAPASELVTAPVPAFAPAPASTSASEPVPALATTTSPSGANEVLIYVELDDKTSAIIKLEWNYGCFDLADEYMVLQESYGHVYLFSRVGDTMFINSKFPDGTCDSWVIERDGDKIVNVTGLEAIDGPNANKVVAWRCLYMGDHWAGK